MPIANDHGPSHADGTTGVGTLAGDDRPLGSIQPLTTDLDERIGAPLCGRSSVARICSRLRIEPGAHCRQDGIACHGIEVAVDPYHPQERGRDVEPSAGAELFVVIGTACALDPLLQ